MANLIQMIDLIRYSRLKVGVYNDASSSSKVAKVATKYKFRALNQVELWTAN